MNNFLFWFLLFTITVSFIIAVTCAGFLILEYFSLNHQITSLTIEQQNCKANFDNFTCPPCPKEFPDEAYELEEISDPDGFNQFILPPPVIFVPDEIPVCLRFDWFFNNKICVKWSE